MDSKELRNLHEAYLDVYAPQENIEEGLRSAVKRLLGGKKEAEAPKPESRGAELRRRYNVGPEGSQTSAKRQILDRSRAKAEKDEKDYGDKPFQKQVAQKSKAAHDKYLKAGYSKYGADLPVSGGQGGSGGSGRGSKAAKRAAALNREEFEIIVNALIEEGYDLSSYTWDEMYDVCLDEAVKGESGERRKDLATERRSGIKPLSTKEGERYASHKLSQMSYVKRQRMGEEVEGLDEIDSSIIARTAHRRMQNLDAAQKKEMGARDVGASAEEQRKRGAETSAAAAKVSKHRALSTAHARSRSRMNNEELDIFDTVLEFLQVEGYAETLEEAEWMMANVIDEEAIDIILGEEQLDELSVNKMLAYVEKGEKNRADLNKKWDKGTASYREKMRVLGREEGEARASDKVEKKTGKRPYEMNALDKARYAVTKEDYMDEAQAARENPEKYEAGQQKKSAPVRGERTPMPPRGDKRREDFEKWYAANVR